MTTLWAGSRAISNAGDVGGGNFSAYWANGVYATATASLPASLSLPDLNQTGQQPYRQPFFRLVGTF
jgi:hypothetical protein